MGVMVAELEHGLIDERQEGLEGLGTTEG